MDGVTGITIGLRAFDALEDRLFFIGFRDNAQPTIAFQHSEGDLIEALQALLLSRGHKDVIKGHGNSQLLKYVAKRSIAVEATALAALHQRLNA